MASKDRAYQSLQESYRLRPSAALTQCSRSENGCRHVHDKISRLNLIRRPCNHSAKENYLTWHTTGHEN